MPYSGSEGEMLKRCFPQPSPPRIVEKQLLPWFSRVSGYLRPSSPRRYELQSQTFDVRG
jgi:hypothetical protein